MTGGKRAPLDSGELRQLLDQARNRNGIVGAAAGLLVDGEVAALAASGTASLRTGLPVTPDTVFQIGSVTKVYTATLVMQLVDEGVLALDEPVSSCLPGVRLGADGAEDHVTVRHLLNHSSGLFGDAFGDFGRGDDAPQRLIATFGELQSLAAPGELMSYCNAGFVLLGRIVEKSRGLPYHRALREFLADRIGAPDTVVLPEEAILRRVAVGHFVPPGDAAAAPVPAPVWSLPAAQVAAGAMTCATVADLLRFAALHLRSGRSVDGVQVLTPASTAAMQQPTVTLPLPTNDMYAVGLGWMLVDHGGVPAFGHAGATIGHNALLHFLPGHGVAIAIVSNGGRDPGALHHDVLTTLLAEIAGASISRGPSPCADPSSIDVEPMLGCFANPLFRHTIRRDGDGQVVSDMEQVAQVHGAPARGYQGAPVHVVDGQQVLLPRARPDGPREVGVVFDPDDAGRYRRLHFGLRIFNRV